MGTETEAIESSRPDSSRSEVSNDWNISSYCDYLGVRVKVKTSKPIEEHGAFSSNSALQY